MALAQCKCGFIKKNISDEHIGKKAKCPKCQVRIIVEPETNCTPNNKELIKEKPQSVENIEKKEILSHHESEVINTVSAEKEVFAPGKHRKENRFYILSVVSFCCALIISFTWHNNESYEEHLIRVQVEQELGYLAESLKREPIELQALFLDYSDDKELLLKANIALMKYQDKASKVLLLYGGELEFKEILINYGEITIPIINYFTENEIKSLKIMHTVEKTTQAVTDAAKNFWNRIVDNEKTHTVPVQKNINLGPEERGWYALHFIKKEGYDFLGQFVIDKQGNVNWIQTERILEGINSFFASGIRTLETKYKTDEDISKSDIFWAGLDVAAMAGTVKLLRIGKSMARSGKQIGIAARTRALASKALSKGKLIKGLAKYSAVAATFYVAIAHPSLINSMLSEFAKLLGLNPLLVQIIGWTLIIFLILYPLLWMIKLIIVPIIWICNLFLSSMLQMEVMLKKFSPVKKMTPDAV